ncbi:MAG: hypothetical protein PW788_04995 [Micavibrio sp.]|nr:hypothetical protein [Micavibrio sp.]
MDREDASLPSSVRKVITTLDDTCKPMGTPSPSPKLVARADLNNDGNDDFIVFEGNYNCDAAEALMANGQNGSDLYIFAGHADHSATLAYQQSVYNFHIETTGGRRRMIVSVAAASCGADDRNVPFAAWEFCDMPLDWNAKGKKFALAPLREKRPLSH